MSPSPLPSTPPPPTCVPWIEREAFIEAFESAYRADPSADLADFLPPRDHSAYGGVLEELVRIDLEHHWVWGLPCRLEEYRERFPELFADPLRLRALAAEEYRLRLRAGQAPAPEEYRERLGVDLLPESVPPMVPEGLLSSRPQVQQFAAARAQLPHPGDQFLGYLLRAELGAGSCGRVFLAEQGGRQYALKLSPDLGDEPAALAKLRHPNIVTVEAVHHAGPVQAVAMPYLGATTLVHVLRTVTFRRKRPTTGSVFFDEARANLPAAVSVSNERRLAARRLLGKMSYVDAVVWVAARLAAGLAHAHDRGVLHRDLKPANVLLADDGRPVLLDFNLAAADDGGTQVGGTLPYMAPEALEAFLGRPRPLDARSDLYSLGVILFQLLTARLPFAPLRDASPAGLAAAVQERFGPPPNVRAHNPAVSPAAAAIVRRLLEADPARRYPDARQLQKELVRCLRRPPQPTLRQRADAWRRQPLGPVWQVGLLTTLLVLLSWLVSR